mmetsp:Transcript_18127/g.17503  ORF Transcript_18127/g.17503 Transcript_18127/m.17503 type:complete len:113 (-) Transcript_18127:482-820(-)|eukprot:CAMPEP_0197830210 /NCGR_PEP_ID=MMETSP1437-20131217/6797_1 /TAXON_ID=49252 ORGANISM="Eucampia antarctica, Strain CCMP1452" /NCGR_SAMPLE_ID=MMETSP1437 /ASSEMBLY_ACC=CAM_ASM_001096 /LENGTH=112 /DNA_ID=CAMNT_0043432425 /DNA_START=117 /DNA_END=455 /DNA_ORIENTATION=-
MAKSQSKGDAKYGIFVTLKVKEGKMDEFLELSKSHFVRQLDGREPNATCASILIPTPGEPNIVRFFEQWETKEDYELHKSHENLNFFFAKAALVLDGDPEIVETAMLHYSSR